MDSFFSLMEFAVAIAGFSGVAIALQARGAVMNELQLFRNKNLITFSLAAAFASAMPEACVKLGASGPDVWSWSSRIFAVFCCGLIASPFRARSVMSDEGAQKLARSIWVMTVGGVFVVLVAQIANTLSVFGEPIAAPIYLGILYLIFLATVMYSRMLFDPRNTEDV